MKRITLTLIIVLLSLPKIYAGELDISRRLMHTTFKIEGKNKTVGTAFVLGKKSESSQSVDVILITAAHVLMQIDGEYATLNIREKNPDVTYTKKSFPLKIRDGKKPLWTQHPEADIAVMRIDFPGYGTGGMPLLPLSFLANDSMVEEQDLHPGDELLCLGYPFGLESSSAGFPVLRKGAIASYPLTPASSIKYFLYDFEVYDGYSGGPVFFEYTGRRVPKDDGIKVSRTVRAIVGIVTQDISRVQKFKSIKIKNPLGLAVVIPSTIIMQTIDLLYRNKPITTHST